MSEMRLAVIAVGRVADQAGARVGALTMRNIERASADAA